MLGGLCVSPAWAAPGDHIRAGEATITPSVMTGLEFHSNVYLADGGTGAPEIPALAWVLKPRLKLSLDGRSAKLGFDAGYGLKKYIDLAPDDGFFPENLDRYSDFDAQLALSILPKSVVGARVDNKFESQGTPSELPTQDEVASASIVHTGNDLLAGAVVRPGSALNVEALGMLGVDSYTVPDVLVSETSGAYNDRLQYGPQVNASWKFLPKTSLISSFSYSVIDWDKNFVEAVGTEVEGGNVGEYLGKPDATGWRLTAGVTGQFTPKLAASGSVGFGQLAYDEQSVIDAAQGVPGSSAELDVAGDDTFATDSTAIDGLLFNLQVSYAPARGHTLTAGYRKDIQDIVFTNYVAYNYLFFRYEGAIQNRFGLGAEANYRIDQYHGEVARGDQNIGLRGSVSYKITSYLTTAGGVGWSRRACFDEDCNNDQYYSTQYDDVSATANVTFTY